MYKISFPHMGNNHIAIRKLTQALAGDYAEVVPAPPITKRTLELGAKHSPDFVCIPFKYNLGNYIEALENGANFLLQTGGSCRLGYYGEVQEQILRDLGYDFEFCVVETSKGDPKEYYKVFKRINPKLTYAKTLKAAALAIRTLFAVDKIAKFVRENIGFEMQKGSFDTLEKEFLREVDKAETVRATGKVYKKYLRLLKELPVNKPENPLKIGMVGELYLLMEPFSNYYIERELAKFGIEVIRYMSTSYRIFSPLHKMKAQLKQATGYLKYDIGGDGTDSIGKSALLAKAGCDGLIHLKPFGCTSEVNSIPMMQRINEDFKIPVLYFSFDTQTSETGIKTRIEAFYDMLEMKRKGTVKT
jgi:predicted nucleotide-binding protein (sugar kinase/HSP70/actin superfamily)